MLPFPLKVGGGGGGSMPDSLVTHEHICRQAGKITQCLSGELGKK